MTFQLGGGERGTTRLAISNTATLARDFAYRRAPASDRSRVDQVFNETWKRVLDIVLSAVALILASPLMLVAMLAVKCTSQGPVLFRQERIGLNRRLRDRRSSRKYKGEDRRGKDRRVVVKFGKPFEMYKFRTMVQDAEKSGPCLAQKKDARITPAGKFLRRTRIDELPQFINVLKGDMSIVGPRPERAYFIAQIDSEVPDFQRRLRTKPGITGLAQVVQGYASSIDEMRGKLDLDLEYIENLKPRMDLKILYKTVSVVITGKGAC